MRDKPYGAALLDVARRGLLDDVVPTLSGQQRYVALMVANAIGIVSREIEQADRAAKAWDTALARIARDDSAGLEASLSRLVGTIRSGQHDADEALYSALVETADVAAGIWKPAR